MKISLNNAGNLTFVGNISNMASSSQLNIESTEIESDSGQLIVCARGVGTGGAKGAKAPPTFQMTQEKSAFFPRVKCPFKLVKRCPFV